MRITEVLEAGDITSTVAGEAAAEGDVTATMIRRVAAATTHFTPAPGSHVSLNHWHQGLEVHDHQIQTIHYQKSGKTTNIDHGNLCHF